jgi:hypothetical protein
MTKINNGSASKIRKASKASKKSAVVAAAPAIIPESPTVRIEACGKCEAAPVAVKAEVPAVVTTIVAKVDVGFGNALFLRGTGPDLSWDKGIEMLNTGSDEWMWTTTKASEDFFAKVLINDVIWSGDPDTMVKAGEKTVIVATF